MQSVRSQQVKQSAAGEEASKINEDFSECKRGSIEGLTRVSAAAGLIDKLLHGSP